MGRIHAPPHDPNLKSSATFVQEKSDPFEPSWKALGLSFPPDTKPAVAPIPGTTLEWLPATPEHEAEAFQTALDIVWHVLMAPEPTEGPSDGTSLADQKDTV